MLYMLFHQRANVIPHPWILSPKHTLWQLSIHFNPMNMHIASYCFVAASVHISKPYPRSDKTGCRVAAAKQVKSWSSCVCIREYWTTLQYFRTLEILWESPIKFWPPASVGTNRMRPGTNASAPGLSGRWSNGHTFTFPYVSYINGDFRPKSSISNLMCLKIIRHYWKC